MSTEQEWAALGVASQQAVDAMRELGKHLRQIADAWESSVAKAAADQMEPAAAPEPEWKPGQLVKLTDPMRELGHLLRQLADSWSSSVAKAAADQMEPATATSPPEPEWRPGQVVRLRLEDDMPYLAKRVDSNDGWEVFGVDVVITDDEVTDVEPVTVLTAEDAGGVAARVAQRMVASGISDGLWTQVAGEAVEDEFRERGLDL